MKTKMDFVTNSSTCSFVIIGFVMSKDEVKKRMILDNKDDAPGFSNISIELDNNDDLYELVHNFIDNGDESIYVGFGSEGGAPNEDSIIFGQELCDIDEDEYICEDLDTILNMEDINKFKKKMNYKGKLKLIAGVRMC